jgi:sugar phosphate isomerase/epimerase
LNAQGHGDLERVHRAVLDTSHAAVAGLDLADTYRRLRGRLAHVHLSNNAGKGWDSHLPVDQGVLPIPAFLGLLSADGFAGRVSLELDIRPYLVDERATQEVLSRNRELCESSLALSA